MDPGDEPLDVVALLAQRSEAAAQMVTDMQGARHLLARGMDDLVAQVEAILEPVTTTDPARTLQDQPKERL